MVKLGRSWPDGEVANTTVCKTVMRGCESRSGLILCYIYFVSGKKLTGLILVFAGCGILIGFLGFRGVINSRPRLAGLKVDTTPQALVYINNREVGLTPLDQQFPPGEINVKLIPNSATSSPTYQTKIKLTAGTYSVINRELGLTENDSAGDTVSIEPSADKTAGLNIVSSVPDSVSVSFDGQLLGNTPFSLENPALGDHQILFTSPGFHHRSLGIQIVSGFLTNVNIKLSPLPSSPPVPEVIAASPSAVLKISSTPTGFLHIRSGPSASASELGKAFPGETYPYLGESSGWYLIRYESAGTSSAWISSQYAAKN
jgi:hypothetical protein